MAVFNTTASTDDGYWRTEETLYYAITNKVYFGYISATSHVNTWLNFPNVNIARGSTINSAVISLAAYDSSTTTGHNVNIGINQAYSPSYPASAAAANAITLGSLVNWSVGSITSTVYYDSPDLSSIVQTYVGNENWNSGQNIMFLIKDNGSTTVKTYVGYEYSSGLYKPYLTVTWTEPSGASFTQKVSMF